MKKILSAILLIAFIICSFSFLNVYANEVHDYRDIDWLREFNINASKPIAKYRIIAPDGQYATSYDGYDLDNNPPVDLEVKLGDTITIEDLSIPNSGYSIDRYDFQVYCKNNSSKNVIKYYDSLPTSWEMTEEGIWDFYLCVRDDTPLLYNIRNWSENGRRQSMGPPLPNYPNGLLWYFVHLRVNVLPVDKPIADMAFSDTDSTIKYITEGESVTIVDKSYTLDGTDIIGWGVKEGDKPESYITNPDSFFKTYTFYGVGVFTYTLNYVKNSNDIKSTNPPKKLTVVVTPKPTPGQGKVLYEYYKDSVKEENLLGTNEVGISNPFIVFLPDTYGDGLKFSSATYSGEAVADGGNCKNGTNITITDATKDLIIQAIYKAGATGPVSSPPIAVITGPKEVMAGDIASVSGAKSEAFDGKKVVAWYWDAPEAELPHDIQRPNIGIWYKHPGEYTVYLYVADSEGLESDTVSHDIKVTMPYPKAVITVTGNLKENRKVTISANDSISPRYYPIDETKTQWTITPLTAGTSTTDIKPSSLIKGANEKDILFKKAGKYKITLKVTNTYGLSDTAEKIIDIAPDLPPVADFAVPNKVLRDPDDNNNALFEIENLSYSPDGDVIDKSMLIYAYDSDNDGNFEDESWKYSINGSSWINLNKSYSQLPALDIFNIGVTNISKFTMKSKEVGKYRFELYVIETFPDDDTLLEFINDSDYRRGNTFE